ncbi:MAG: nicotinamide mononucleotide deamidase-related protein [Thermoprotei archaeon]
MSTISNASAKKAEILTIGNEILTGRVTNTNASYIARRLSLLGISVKRITVVADEESEIIAAVKEAISRQINYLITTGGLGPTYDDISMSAIGKALGLPLKLNDLALQWVLNKTHAENMPLTPEREKMALLPFPCKELDNPVGVAPGAWIEVNNGNTTIIVLPGVPSEMESMIEKHLIPVLVKRQNLFVAEKEFRVIGIYEATLAPFVKKLVKNDEKLYVKTHPGLTENQPSMLIHIEYASESKEESEQKASQALNLLKAEALRLGAQIKG